MDVASLNRTTTRPKKIHRLIHVQIYRPKSVLFDDIVHRFLDVPRHIWRVDDEFSQIVSTRELLVDGNVEELLALASERIFEYFFNIREPVFDCVFSFVGDIRVRFLFRDGVEIGDDDDDDDDDADDDDDDDDDDDSDKEN